MKTTFKTVLPELEDDIMNIDIKSAKETNINIDKIKGDVFMRIKSENTNKPKKRISKKLLVLLVAAAVTIGGTIAVAASGGVENIVGGFFDKKSDFNALGLYEASNVTVKTADSSLDVKVLGTLGGGGKYYSVLEVSKKDGSPLLDEGCYLFDEKGLNVRTKDNGAGVEPEFTDSNGNILTSIYNTDSDVDNNTHRQTGRANCQYTLDDENKTIKIFISNTIYDKNAFKGGRSTYKLDYLNATKVKRVLGVKDCPEMVSIENAGLTDEEIENVWNFIKDEEAKIRAEYGLKEDDCYYLINNNKSYYCERLTKNQYDNSELDFIKDMIAIDLGFVISMDVNYEEDRFISFDIDTKTAPNTLNERVSSANVLITPFAVYFESNNEYKITMISDSEQTDRTYLTLKDGSKYYFYRYKGNADLRYSSVPGQPLTYSSMDFPALILDPAEIQTVVINGDTIYNA